MNTIGDDHVTEEMRFFIYLLECYVGYKKKSTGEVLKEWDKHHIIDKVYNNYWQYHTEAMEDAYKDIDSLLETGKYAY